MPKKILFRVDGGCAKNTGTGHIFRCLLLARELRERYALIFVSVDRAEYEYGHAQIKKKGYRLHLLPPDRYHDVLRALVLRQKPDFIICDMYEYEEEELRILKSLSAPLMTFDHFDAHRQYSDYTINAVSRRQENRFDGLKYIVIPRPKRRPVRQIPAQIVVCVGGFDYGDLTFKILSALVRSRIAQRVDVIVTDLYFHLDRLKELARQTETTVTLHVQPDNFEELLSDCDVAFVSGGLTMFQALSVGASVVVISQYEHQRRTVEDFGASGAYIDLGTWDRLDESRIEEVVTCLLADAAQRRALGHNATTLVDGKGLQRVVRLVEDELEG